MARRRWLALVILLGLLWRLVVSAQMVVPREDGVNYLWMAERFAEGAVSEGLSEVFSPLLALLIAVPVAFGVEPFFAGQLVLALVGAWTVVPLAAISERLFPGTERWAALLACVAARPVMLGAEIYTEPLFLLLGSYAFLFGLRRGYLCCGLFTGLAFWVRPEAALIPLVFLRRVPASWLPVLVTLVMVAALAIWRGACGHGFDPVPKLAFIAAHNVAGETDTLGFILRTGGHLLEVPKIFFSAFGGLALLALVGLWFGRPRQTLYLFGLAILVICLYVPRWRFLVNWMFLVIPLGALALSRFPGPRWLVTLVILHNLVWSLAGGINPNRRAEPAIAIHLQQQLRPTQRIAGDMTRVHYFAGQRPLPPRHFTAAELIEAARNAEFVVLRAKRKTTPAVVAGLPDHQPYALPDELQSLATARDMIILQHR